MRVAYAIWPAQMVRAREALVRCRYAKRQSALNRNDAIGIPPADKGIDKPVALAEESTVDADWDLPDYVCHKALTDIESGVTHFSSVVVCVLRLRIRG